MRELLDKIAAITVTLNGWCTPEKALWIAQHIINRCCVTAVDLGVFGGRSLVAIGLAMQYLAVNKPGTPFTVYGVDSYSNQDCVDGEESPEGKNYWRNLDMQAVRKNAEDAIEGNKLGEICKLMIMRGTEAVKWFDDGTLDFVHVDGSHSTEESCRDVKLWWPKLRAGGVMLMDDTNWPTVLAARNLAESMGRLIFHHAQWEAFLKHPPSQQGVEFPAG